MSETVVTLVRHPESPGLGVMRLQAAVARMPEGGLRLVYQLTGATAGLRIAAPLSGSGREDGLWRHTCLELFVRAPGATAYREFNFSPAGAWQAYAFHAYREGGAMPAEAVPQITATHVENAFTLDAHLPAALLPPGPLQAGLSAVIESRDGRIAYWALRHPKPKPDFHDALAFILELP